MRVDGEPLQVRRDLGRVGRVALRVGPPEEDVLVADGQVEDDFAIGGLECVGGVSWEGVGGAEPLLDRSVGRNHASVSLVKQLANQKVFAYLHVRALCSSPWEDTEVKRYIGIPLPVLTPRLHALKIARLRDNGEYDLGDR